MNRGDSFLRYWGGHVFGPPFIVYAVSWGSVCYVTSRAFDVEFDRTFWRPLCWIAGHYWADDDEWGVEPICLRCKRAR